MARTEILTAIEGVVSVSPDEADPAVLLLGAVRIYLRAEIEGEAKEVL